MNNSSSSFQNNINQSQYDFKNVKQMPPQSSYGKQSRQGQPLGTAMRQQSSEQRPITSLQRTNFNNNIDNKKPKPEINLIEKSLDSPEEQQKQVEREINELVEQSASAAVQGRRQDSLEKAKEAAVREKNYRRQKEQNNQEPNLELTYWVSFNLAIQYQNYGLLSEALQKYNEIIKSKQFPQAGRLRVNMGNIYFMQKKYPTSIKMYRMALDIIPAHSKEMRFKILKNIGHAFVKLGQFNEAINSYDSIMKGSPDFQTGFNLLLCLYALGDKFKMKECFNMILSVEIPGMIEQDEDELLNDENTQEDKLKEDIKQKKREAFKYIIDASKLIAPIIETDIITGYEWILDQLKGSNYPEVESEIEISKAMAYLKKKNIEKAIDTLRGFEKKDKVLMARAASNISFLYFLEGDVKNAEKYSETALNFDRYNAKALVNRGNCLFMRNEFLRAKDQFLEAIGVEADCIEALYNLAYVNKKLNKFIESLQALEKLQTLVSGVPEVIYQIASIYEMMGNVKQAFKWYQILLTKVPNEPTILSRLGAISAKEEDENQALNYFTDSYRYLPTNLETISWLGFYYVKHDLYERACHFFERAAQIQPKELKWKLMVAGCYRRIGNYQRALKLYEEINQENPYNLECLRFLMLLSKEMNLPYEHYAAQVKRIEREQEALPDYNTTDIELMSNQQREKSPGKSTGDNFNIKVGVEPKKKIQQKNKIEDEWNDLDDDMLPQ